MSHRRGAGPAREPDGSVLIFRAPAKINLWLEVIAKREDGYHDISSLMLPISIYDRISVGVRPEGAGITLACDTAEIPCDERNLAWRAARMYLESGSITAGVELGMQKRIPWGAGLGGGSSDAAGVLTALDRLYENRVPRAELDSLALKLGADVPFFLDSRPALATGIGERLRFAQKAPAYSLLLIKPPVCVPTGWVYQNLKLTKSEAQIKLASFEENPFEFGDLLGNDLESVTVCRYPVIAEIKRWLLENGALAASMSGSGPTVFGIFKTARSASDAAGLASTHWLDCWVQTAQVIGGNK